MILAFKLNKKFTGIHIQAHDVSCPPLVELLQIILDKQNTIEACKTVLDKKPTDNSYESFAEVSEEDFINIRHTHAGIENPNGEFVGNHCLVQDYILLDLDDNKILTPDFTGHNPESMQYCLKQNELKTLYEAYQYACSSLDNYKYYPYAFKNELIVCQSPLNPEFIGEHHVVISFEVEFRKCSPNSPKFTKRFYECCQSFECNCTDEEKAKYLAPLPF